MTIFDVLNFVGGLALFLFGMNFMGNALEKKAGGQLSGLLSKFTSNKYMGFLLGMIVTSIIQSSSATTVMVVGFVNSGIMALSQAVGVIIGANIGTTVTAWILSLTNITGSSIILQFLKPSSFTPILAIIGVVFYMFLKNGKKRDTGMILLGFAVLMFGMETVSDSVSGLRNVPQFTELFVMFKNPVLGLLVGAMLTAVIQSSSASVGILQALSVTGQVSIAAAFPILLGQQIGTCVTAMLSSVGANKKAKQAAVIHLSFNIIGSAILLITYYGASVFVDFTFADAPANAFTIAVIHTLCNLVKSAIFLPGSNLLLKLSQLLVKDKGEAEEIILDERLFVNPAAALEQSRERVSEMAKNAVVTVSSSLGLLSSFNENKLDEIRKAEGEIDKYEDVISSYLVKLSTKELSDENNIELTKLIHVTSGFERISDHAVHIGLYAREIDNKNLAFSPEAKKELSVIVSAVFEVIDMTVKAFRKNDLELASRVEPLEQVIDKLTSKAKKNHVERMLKDNCSFELGLLYSDILSVLERVSDHCSEIAASIIEISHSSLGVHEYLNEYKSKDNDEFIKKYQEFKAKYSF